MAIGIRKKAMVMPATRSQRRFFRGYCGNQSITGNSSFRETFTVGGLYGSKIQIAVQTAY
jgi:hypothetical protein